MTQRQPRKPRRKLPAPSLPRPGQAAPAYSSSENVATSGTHHREHHITTDFSYVMKDLVLIGIVGSISLAFIVVVSFLI